MTSSVSMGKYEVSNIHLFIIWLVSVLGLFGIAFLFEEAGVPVGEIERLGIPGLDFGMVSVIITALIITYLFELK